MQEKILDVQSLKKIYGKNEGATMALNGLSFQVLEGEFLGIMGSSGSGKTTLLNCIATMTRPTEGRILLGKEDISELKGSRLAKFRGFRVGYLFQNFELLEHMTGEENILLPTAIHKQNQKEVEKRLKDLADYLEIKEVLHKFPSQMSGGQKQRVAAARALIVQPEILLADEPTSALDVTVQKQVVEELLLMREEFHTSMILVTHNMGLVKKMTDRVLVLCNGQMMDYGKTEEVLQHPESAYTQELMDSVVRLKRKQI